MAAFIVAAASTAFVWVTMQTTLVEVDGYRLTALGFPLPWCRASLASSCHAAVDFIALGIDALAYLAVAAAFAYPIRRSLALVLASRRWLARIVVIVATLSVALMGLDLASIGEPGRFGVVTDDWTAFERELVIGSFPSNVRRLH